MAQATQITELDLNTIKELDGTLVAIAKEGDKQDRTLRKLNTLTRGQIDRVMALPSFDKAPVGSVHKISVPTNVAAEAILIAKVSEKPSQTELRKAGSKAASSASGETIRVLLPKMKNAEELVFGAALRLYQFVARKSGDQESLANLIAHSDDVKSSREVIEQFDHLVAGVHFTRDLVNEPANVLTTEEFATRLVELEGLGLKTRVLDEVEMADMGMGALLGVGQGSESPSKIVVMEHMGGGDEAPFALVGKGVVFDTGGISLKPAGGMEDMTMDMGGAGVVAGVMKTLALRKAKANVVGLVGLVENMPDARAQRPGDVVTSMKGDTIEVINTDAEGRLVLADVLWYAQKTYNPSGVIDLATLTGAIIIGLGHENAGVFSNNDDLSDAFLKAASATDEGAWRLPLGKAYDDMLKSRIADMKNVGGRAAGSITAAQFLQRFIKEDMPWIHLDIAGVASVKSATAYADKGATGWGVRALNQLIADNYEH